MKIALLLKIKVITFYLQVKNYFYTFKTLLTKDTVPQLLETEMKLLERFLISIKLF